jgi:hypothetical protein
VHENIGGIFKTDCKINLFEENAIIPLDFIPSGTAFLLLSNRDPLNSSPPKLLGVPVIENYGIYPLQINILIDDKVVELDLYVNAFSKIFKGY